MLVSAGCPWACRCYCFVTAALALMVIAAARPHHYLPGTSDRGHGGPVIKNDVLLDSPTDPSITIDEGQAIQPIDIPFLQREGDWERPGNGISMGSLGEPKSGTTWTERVITELALQLCGSSTNTWCQMGGLLVFPNRPDPSYVWEILHADTGELFLHFDGRTKHTIPGLEVGNHCNPLGTPHPNGFGMKPPCKMSMSDITRGSLLQCMPIKSRHCARLMPSRNPAVRRTAVVFRDPRDVVISERRMKLEVYHIMKGNRELIPFIERRFEKIVSWQFVRWEWHTKFYENESHVMFYEDLQADPEKLEDLAAFMGLNCSKEQALDVWERHRKKSPHGNFNTYDLPVETMEMMNATMAKLLPKTMLDRYGLSQSLVS